jgi:hypothetical protein
LIQQKDAVLIVLNPRDAKKRCCDFKLFRETSDLPDLLKFNTARIPAKFNDKYKKANILDFINASSTSRPLKYE